MKTYPITFPAIAALLLVGTPLAAQNAAAKSDDAEEARRLVGLIAKREAAAGGGRVTLLITERRANYRPDEGLEALRKRLEMDKEVKPLLAEGSFVFSPQGWLKELTVPPSRPGGQPSRTRTGELNGSFRMLVEATVEGAQRRAGRLLPATLTAPADALLGRRVAKSMADLQWATVTPEGETVKLVGFRSGERHAITLKYKAEEPEATGVQRWELTRSLTSPTGERLEQTYACEVSGEEAAGGVTRLEEWVLNPPPAGNVAYRITEAKPRAGDAVKLDDLAIRFPKGTQITDLRTGDPVEYELTEDGATEADLAQATSLLTKGRARIGDSAPAFELRDLKGGTVKLSDYKEKAVLLLWFSSDGPRAEETGKFFKELHDDYRKRGVEFLGLSIAEQGDVRSQVESYRKNAKWTFPLAFDSDSEAMRRYGSEAGVPKVAVVDRNGTLIYVRAGIDPEGIVAALEKVAKEKK